MNFIKVLAVCGVSLVAAVAASPVDAKPPARILVVANPADYLIRHVSYADLNLASAPGERSLHRRIAFAVNNLCDEALGEPSSSSNTFAYQECTGSAWNGAGPQITAAVNRAREISTAGTSLVAASAITIYLPK